MRGKRCASLCRSRMRGITPACAGKTPAPPRAHRPGKDHPRVCGENRAQLQKRRAALGSPPRVRGKLQTGSYTNREGRITPACAGKTDMMRGDGADEEDHPRVCGENSLRPTSSTPRKGSPPRVRGKRFCLSGCLPAGRITPACAGKTATGHAIPCRGWDHPRVCGENRVGNLVFMLRPGSPPRVRGKPVSPLSQRERIGITPACAGKTLSMSSRILRRKDHPRVCGENTAKIGKEDGPKGSPPRVRGKHAGTENL